MKKNQLYRLTFLAMLPALVLTSCKFEDDDLFDESAALRIEHKSDEMKSLLSSAPNGWVMQFFCASDEGNYEGFNLFARFEMNGKVTMASNHRMLRDGNAGKYTEDVSVYELLKEDGLILAFNVWNDILTPFTDPVDPSAAPKNIVKDGTGMHGDHNFVIMSNSDNEIILRGERHQAEVRLVKCDRDWQTYISDVETMKSKITNSIVTDYSITNGSETLYFTSLNTGKPTYTDALEVKKQTWANILSCVFTPTGFRLEKENSIGDNKFHEFTLSEDQTCLVNEDGSVKVSACWDNYIISHNALWKFDRELFSAEQNELFNKIDTEIKKYNKDWSIESLGIGQSTGSKKINGLVITFYTNAAKTKTNTAGVSFTQTKPGTAQLKIEYSDEDIIDKNMESIVKKAADVETYARLFAKTLNGTYNVTPNDYFLPTGGDFTAVEGGTTFRLK